MIAIRRYRKDDIAAVAVSNHYCYVDESLPDRGDTFTFYDLDSEEILAVAGTITFMPGCESLWANVSTYTRGRGVALTRIMRRFLAQYMRIYRIHRMQVFVEDEKPEYQRWVRALGFHFESVMFFATPQKQHIRIYTLLQGVECYTP